MDFEKIKSNIQKKIQETKRALDEKSTTVPLILKEFNDNLKTHYEKISNSETNVGDDAVKRMEKIEEKYEKMIFERIREYDNKTKECEQFLDALQLYSIYYENLTKSLEMFPVDASFFDDSNYYNLHNYVSTINETNSKLLSRTFMFHPLWKKEAIALEEAVYSLHIKNKEFLIDIWDKLNKGVVDASGNPLVSYMNELWQKPMLYSVAVDILSPASVSSLPTMGFIEFENKSKTKVKNAQVELIKSKQKLEKFALDTTIKEMKHEKSTTEHDPDETWNALAEKIKDLTAERDIAEYKLNFREQQRTVLMAHMFDDLNKLNIDGVSKKMKEKIINELIEFVEKDEIIDNDLLLRKAQLEEAQMLEDKYKIYKRMNKLGEYRENLEKTIYSDMAPRITSNQQLLDKIIKDKKDLEIRIGKNVPEPPPPPLPPAPTIDDKVVEQNKDAIAELKKKLDGLTRESDKKKNTAAIKDLKKKVEELATKSNPNQSNEQFVQQMDKSFEEAKKKD